MNGLECGTRDGLFRAPNGVQLTVPGGYPTHETAPLVQANPGLLAEARRAAALAGHDVGFAAQRAAAAAPPMEGDQLLTETSDYIGRFVAYPTPHAQVAHVLWIAHAHLMDAWDSTPRIAFLSPEPGSGKSRCLEVMEPLVPRAVEAVNVTPAYLFRKVNAEEGRPTILYDEIDTVFGPKAKDNEEIRGLLNAGHRKHAVAGRCVVRGKEVFTEEIPAYCAVALAGLGGLPDTILTRSVVIRMRRRAPNEHVEPYRRRINGPEAEQIAVRLAEWMGGLELAGVWPVMPDGIQDRDADVWEPLLAVADAAGGNWPDRARAAAIALVAESKQSTPSLGINLLRDMREVFGSRDTMPSEEILAALTVLIDSPWGDLRGKPLDARGLGNHLRPYGIGPAAIRVGNRTLRGYKRADLHDAWCRYLAEPPQGSATSATADTRSTNVERIAPVADSGSRDQALEADQ